MCLILFWHYSLRISKQEITYYTWDSTCWRCHYPAFRVSLKHQRYMPHLSFNMETHIINTKRYAKKRWTFTYSNYILDIFFRTRHLLQMNHTILPFLPFLVYFFDIFNKISGKYWTSSFTFCNSKYDKFVGMFWKRK